MRLLPTFSPRACEDARIETLIPERTIDAWTSSAITTREPRALIWAPTPPAQAPEGNQPWDFAVGVSPAKLLVIENKSLINTSMKGLATRVSVSMAQLCRLLDLEVDGLPVFYGLPGLQPGQLPFPIPPEPFVQRAGWRLQPPFRHWQRMIRPTELLMLPPVLTAFINNQEMVHVDTALITPFVSLNSLLTGVLSCREGVLLPPDPRSPGWPLERLHSDRFVEREMEQLRSGRISPSADPAERLRQIRDRLAPPEVAESSAGGAITLHLRRAMWMAIPTGG